MSDIRRKVSSLDPLDTITGDEYLYVVDRDSNGEPTADRKVEIGELMVDVCSVEPPTCHSLVKKLSFDGNVQVGETAPGEVTVTVSSGGGGGGGHEVVVYSQVPNLTEVNGEDYEAVYEASEPSGWRTITFWEATDYAVGSKYRFKNTATSGGGVIEIRQSGGAGNLIEFIMPPGEQLYLGAGDEATVTFLEPAPSESSRRALVTIFRTFKEFESFSNFWAGSENTGYVKMSTSGGDFRVDPSTCSPGSTWIVTSNAEQGNWNNIWVPGGVTLDMPPGMSPLIPDGATVVVTVASPTRVVVRSFTPALEVMRHVSSTNPNFGTSFLTPTTIGTYNFYNIPSHTVILGEGFGGATVGPYTAGVSVKFRNNQQNSSLTTIDARGSVVLEVPAGKLPQITWRGTVTITFVTPTIATVTGDLVDAS